MYATPFAQTAAGRQGLRKRDILGVALSEMQTSKPRIKNVASEWIQCLLSNHEKKGAGGGWRGASWNVVPGIVPLLKNGTFLCSYTIFRLAGLLFSQAGLDLLLFVSVPVPGIAQVPERNSSFPPITGKGITAPAPTWWPLSHLETGWACKAGHPRGLGPSWGT